MAVKTLELLLTANAKQAIYEVEKLTGAVESSTASMGAKFAAFGKKVAIVGGVAFAFVAAESVRLADQYEKSHARLTASLKANGSSWDAWKATVDKAVKSQEKFGYNATVTENALSRLTTAGKSQTDSLKLLGVADDLAAARHIGLEQALQLVIRASGGTYTALLRLGIITKEQAKQFTSGAQAVDFLGQKFKGQASAAADTLGGKLKAMGAQLQDVGIKIGQFLIPILEALITALSDVVTWMGKHKEAAIALAVVVGGVLLAAVTAYTVSMIAAAAATIAATWPILLIIAAVTALIAIVVVIATKWNEIWNWISHNPAYAILIGALAAIFAPILLIGFVIGALAANWQAAWNWMKQAAADAVGFITSLLHPLISLINTVVGAFNSIFSGKGSLSHVPNTPSFLVPKLASGGIVTRPTLAMIGEAGPEAVVPLNRTLGSSPLGSGDIYIAFNFDQESGQATVQRIVKDDPRLRNVLKV